jgi:hypothetical protein
MSNCHWMHCLAAVEEHLRFCVGIFPRKLPVPHYCSKDINSARFRILISLCCIGCAFLLTANLEYCECVFYLFFINGSYNRWTIRYKMWWPWLYSYTQDRQFQQQLGFLCYLSRGSYRVAALCTIADIWIEKIWDLSINAVFNFWSSHFLAQSVPELQPYNAYIQSPDPTCFGRHFREIIDWQVMILW